MYHVGVSNIFELLDDENDQEGKRVVHASGKQESAQGKGKAAAPVATKEAPKKSDAAPVKASLPPRERSDKRPRADDDRRPPRDRKPREPRQEGAAGGERSADGKRDSKERGFTARNPSKRTFDRKSGTGRGKEGKKSGGGRGNWGKAGEENWDEGAGAEPEKTSEEAKPAEGVAAPAKEPEAPLETEEQKKAREEEEKKKKEEEEKEARQITLDVFLKQQQEKGAALPELPAPRKPGEGVDKKELQQWSKFTVLKKEEGEKGAEVAEKKEEKKKEPKQEGKKDAKKDGKKDAKPEVKKQEAKQVPVDSVLRIQKPERERRERKDSPRSSGPKRVGGGNGGARGPSAPDVKDSSSFPALSVKA